MTISAARFPCRALVATLAGAVATACSSSREPTPPTCEISPAAVAGAPSALPRDTKPGGSVRLGPRRAASTAKLPPATVREALGCDLSPAVPADQPFTVSGDATYDFVPAVYDPATTGGGLDFARTEQKPVREADVEVRQCGDVLATTTTDVAGHYSVTFTPSATGEVAVYVLARVADPPLTVQDNWAAATWAVAQPITSASPTLPVHATHGWNVSSGSYGPSRIAAPFAILDDLYTASRRLLEVPRDVPFRSAPLTVNWSPLNTPDTIGTSYYDPSLRQIFILGADGIDTDEFDREVIVHEWGHYLQDVFSRSDSPGASHYLGDVLDPRLAFDEGYASAFAAMLLQEPIYADTYWVRGAPDAFGFDAETRPAITDDPAPSVFSELSVVRALWDLYDAGTNESAYDGAALGVGPIYDTLVGPGRTTLALTTIASFVAGLKAQPGVAAPAVDAVLAHHGMGPIASEWGDGDARLRAMYTNLPSPSQIPLQVTATLNGGYRWNERPQNQYYVFTATGTQATVTSSSSLDVDLYAVHRGTFLAAAESASGHEAISFATVPGEVYVVVLTGWGGISSGDPCVGDYPVAVSFTSP